MFHDNILDTNICVKFTRLTQLPWAFSIGCYQHPDYCYRLFLLCTNHFYIIQGTLIECFLFELSCTGFCKPLYLSCYAITILLYKIFVNAFFGNFLPFYSYSDIFYYYSVFFFVSVLFDLFILLWYNIYDLNLRGDNTWVIYLLFKQCHLHQI